MNVLLVLPFALPLLAASLGVLARRHLAVQRGVTSALMAGLLGTAGTLVAVTRGGEAVATRMGGWPEGLAITFAADGLSALMVAVASGMATLAVVFAAACGEDRHQLFHPMVAVLLAGVLGSFVTADLFNLFVTFEVMLIGSYVLLTLRGGRRQVRAGTIYVAVNLLASTILLIGIGLIYGAAGTVHLGDLADVTSRVPTAAVGAAVVLVAVGVKASLVPMHGWLPRAYVQAGPAVTALFSGLLTKAGVYVLYRLFSVLFAGDAAWRPVFLTVAAITMLIGVLGAVGSTDMRGILAFHMVSQVGYLILPLGLWTVAGVTAGLVYLVQYVFVKGALFVAAGTVELLTGSGRLADLGGMARIRPWVAVGFAVPALALAGLPPTSGFVGKFLLVRAAFEGEHWLAGGVAVLVSLFTLLSMVKIWGGAFWGEPTARVLAQRASSAAGIPVPAGGASDQSPAAPATAAPRERRRVAVLLAPALLVGVLTIVAGIGAQPLIELVEPAARALLEPTAYLEAVRSA